MVYDTKTKLVKAAIEKLLDKGIIDLSVIYSIICDKYGMQRSSVRRIKKELVEDMIFKVKILTKETGKKPVPKSVPSDIDNLDPIEQRILEVLKNHGMVYRYRTIFDTLNFNTNYPPISKKKLTHYLGKLCAAYLIKKLKESRYRIMGKENVR